MEDLKPARREGTVI